MLLQENLSFEHFSEKKSTINFYNKYYNSSCISSRHLIFVACNRKTYLCSFHTLHIPTYCQHVLPDWLAEVQCYIKTLRKKSTINIKLKKKYYNSSCISARHIVLVACNRKHIYAHFICCIYPPIVKISYRNGWRKSNIAHKKNSEKKLTEYLQQIL